MCFGCTFGHESFRAARPLYLKKVLYTARIKNSCAGEESGSNAD